MTIERLMKAVPVPAAPFEAFSGPWEPIEAELGTVLPQDYKDFVRLYGGGYFMEFLGICVPESQNANVRLVTRARIVSGIFSSMDEDWPYALWPAPGGLLSFGGTDNGDELFWDTRGAPDEWGVVVWDRGFGEFEAFDCGLTDFLAGLATGDIAPKEFPDDLLPCDALFEPNSV
jgi:hypothetical protein